jgi:precorrin-6B methylase 2
MIFLPWIVAIVAVALWARERARRERLRAQLLQQGWPRPWPIAKATLPEIDPIFTPDRFGPTSATEVRFIGRGAMDVPGGTSDAEAWILAALALNADRLVEFGTCTGKTSYLWARNSPPTARIVTLTLAPDQQDAVSSTSEDSKRDVRFARQESTFTEFMYSNTDVAHKVTQHFADSKLFDETTYLDFADVVFVDGSHAYSYVVSDSAKAMRIVKPGGLVLWHDYRGPHHTVGVYRGLNELARSHDLRHIEGTSLVAWRRPAASTTSVHRDQ